MKLLPFVVVLTTLIFFPAAAQEPQKGIQDEKAPPLGVTEWINLPEGRERIGIPDYKGKVLVMLLFQSTCEACHERAFPTLQKLVKKFGDSPEVGFIAIQTPFEDYADNTQMKLEPTAEKFKLTIPFGHLAKTPDVYNINTAYKTGGTPWWVVVDREGTVIYNGFYLNPEEAEKNLAKMIAGLPVGG
ncbi:MAG: TlpA family protein disulfide reductase [Verrucomicrobiota bacterium]